jgi:hypothetical protein
LRILGPASPGEKLFNDVIQKEYSKAGESFDLAQKVQNVLGRSADRRCFDWVILGTAMVDSGVIRVPIRSFLGCSDPKAVETTSFISVDCLSEAHDACQPDHRNLNLFTAAAWLSLARQDEAIESVIASWNTPKAPEPRTASFIFQGVLGCFGQPFLAPQMLPAFLRDRLSPEPGRSAGIACITRRATS